MTRAYDLAFAWSWEFDSDFARLLRLACNAQNITMLEITPRTLSETLSPLASGTISFRTLFDRAWDEDKTFRALGTWAHTHATPMLNNATSAERAWDKTAMHEACAAAGLPVRPTIVLPPFDAAPDFPTPDLAPFGPCWVMKPAHGGGGNGVRLNLTRWEKVKELRREFPHDAYLLHPYLTPRETKQGPLWFRMLHVFGDILPFWWDPETHRYRPLTPTDEERYGLAPLRAMTKTVARLCGLELFSTEIAADAESDAFFIMDYVNDPMDLRLQSRVSDGVPDGTVALIANRIAVWTRTSTADANRTTIL